MCGGKIAKGFVSTTIELEKAVLVGLNLKRKKTIWDSDDSLKELGQLAESVGAKVLDHVTQKIERPTSTYLGKGKLETLVDLTKNLSCTVAIFDDELAKRRQVASRYDQLLYEKAEQGNLKLPKIEKHNTSSWGQYTVEVQEREKVQSRLAADGIPTAVHYPLPLYVQPALKNGKTDYSNADAAAKHVLSLPMHPYLKSHTQDRIVASLINAIDH